MSFEQVGAQFAQLQAQYRSGAISPEQYQAAVSQLRLQDAAGRWWQIEPQSGQWMMWDGNQWTWPQQQAQPVQPAPQPAARPYQAQPQYPGQAAQFPGQPQPAAYPAQYGAQAAPAVQRPGVPMYPGTAAQGYPAQYQPAQALPGQPPAQASLTVGGKKAHVAIWEGLAPVVPGLGIGLLQNWPSYSKDPAMMAGFVVPSLLPAVLVPLVPYVGRVLAILVVIGCLIWLSWPLVAQASTLLGNAKAVQSQAGRGLVGVSLLYLLPRIWKIK